VLADAFGVPPEQLAFMSQVHGSAVAVVDRPQDGVAPAADALVTAQPGLALAVLVADCAPVVLTDPTAGVVAVAHAGRRGMARGIVAATLAAMRDLGSQPETTAALVGPAICGRCYEVPESLQAEVVAIEPAARSTTRSGAAALDIRAGVVAQLEAAGIASVEVDPTCTAEATWLYSHRRDGVTGRFAALVLLAPQ
jgi:YfiH family protein